MTDDELEEAQHWAKGKNEDAAACRDLLASYRQPITPHLQELAERAAGEIVKTHETTFAWGEGRSICVEGTDLDDFQRDMVPIILRALSEAMEEEQKKYRESDALLDGLYKGQTEALRARVAELEGENERLKGLARQSQEAQ